VSQNAGDKTSTAACLKSRLHGAIVAGTVAATNAPTGCGDDRDDVSAGLSVGYT